MNNGDFGDCTLSVEELVENFDMSAELEACLDDLEARIDPETEESLLTDCRTFLDGKHPATSLFEPKRSRSAAPQITWPAVSVNDALTDFNKMALQQFCACSRLLADAGGAPPAVRANYGVCISSSWYGCELRMMDPEIETLPTSLPLANGEKDIDALLEKGAPDVTAGYSARVYAMGHIFKKIMSGYPNISRYVQVYHPDFQSPIDTCELVWGSDVLIAFYESPERVHRLLDLLTETYIDAVDRWSAIHPFAPEINAHWDFMHKGNIILRTDSGMNLSPNMYNEFIRPYEQRCLDACGGGAIHFCGKGDHFISAMSELKGLTGINLAQPEYNNMETIYQNTADKGIPLLGLDRSTAEKALARGRNLHGLVWAK